MRSQYLPTLASAFYDAKFNSWFLHCVCYSISSWFSSKPIGWLPNCSDRLPGSGHWRRVNPAFNVPCHGRVVARNWCGETLQALYPGETGPAHCTRLALLRWHRGNYCLKPVTDLRLRCIVRTPWQPWITNSVIAVNLRSIHHLFLLYKFKFVYALLRIVCIF
jgi:hypothetical protein